MKSVSLFLVCLGLSGCAAQAEQFFESISSPAIANEMASMRHATVATGSIDGHSLVIRSWPDIGYTYVYVAP